MPSGAAVCVGGFYGVVSDEYQALPLTEAQVGKLRRDESHDLDA